MRLNQMRKTPYFIEEIPQFSLPNVGLAVLGHPISHSISPLLHNAALQHLATTDLAFKNWSYERVDVEAKFLSAALTRLSESGYLGLNLTIPHKVEALNTVTNLDAEATMMGAVNTLHFKNEEWYGYNTDGYGLHRALVQDLGCVLRTSKVLILGAGGAARAAAVKCLMEGAIRVHIHNRTQGRLSELLELLKGAFTDSRVTGSSSQNFEESAFDGQDWLVINATALGLKDTDPSPFFMSCTRLGENSVVYDMIYNPVQTRLLAEASAAGLAISNGLSMLVYQAAKALEIWTECKVSAQVMAEAAQKHFTR